MKLITRILPLALALLVPSVAFAEPGDAAGNGADHSAASVKTKKGKSKGKTPKAPKAHKAKGKAGKNKLSAADKPGAAAPAPGGGAKN